MRIRSLFLAAATCFVLSGFLPQDANAQTIYGLWRSTTGNVFEIPYSPGNYFDMVVTYTNGQRAVLRGGWVGGMRGSQFYYTAGGSSCTGTFSAMRSNVVRVVCNGRASWWKRSGSRKSRSVAYAGTWQSTSGARFVVPASRGAFNIIATFRNGRKAVYRAYWVPGMVGIQFRYGNPAITVTYNPRNPGVLRVVDARGSVFWWKRLY